MYISTIILNVWDYLMIAYFIGMTVGAILLLNKLKFLVETLKKINVFVALMGICGYMFLAYKIMSAIAPYLAHGYYNAAKFIFSHTSTDVVLVLSRNLMDKNVTFNDSINRTIQMGLTIHLITLFVLCIPLPLFIKSWTKKRSTEKRASHERLQTILRQRMKNPSAAGYAFEKFVVDMYIDNGMRAELAVEAKRRGDYPALLASGGGDGGVDVIVYGQDTIRIVQVKLYAKEVKKEVLASLKIACEVFEKKYPNHKIQPVLVCWSGVDNTAHAYAKHMNCELYNEESVREFIAA